MAWKALEPLAPSILRAQLTLSPVAPVGWTDKLLQLNDQMNLQNFDLVTEDRSTVS